MGKLVIHVAENGRSYKLDCDENTLVESVHKFLESASGILSNDQLLLCLDLKLESHRPLSAYKLPSDAKEVFLFNKAKMRSSSPDPAPEEVKIVDIPDPTTPSPSHNPHPLDDSADPALKALPSYERQFRYHFQWGEAIYGRTVAKLETCERLLREQKVQERALEIAGGNLNHFYKMILQNYAEFVKCYSRQYRSHTNLLVNFGREIKKLRSIKLMPTLQTADRKCLLDFVKEESLRKAVDDCSNSHRQFEIKVSEFQLEFGDLKRNTEHLFSRKASFLVKDLDLSIKDHQKFINEQKSMMQALSKDVNTVKKLVNDCISCQLSSSLRPHDAVSALGPMYDSHDKNYLPKMQSCERAITDFLYFCMDKKNEMNIFVHNYMQKIAHIQYNIKDVRFKFSVFQEALKRQSDQFEQLKVMRAVGPAYRSCLAEVVRRKAALKIYMGKAGRLAEKLAMDRDAEVRRRDEFLKIHSNYIPRDVLASMGLYDTPNPCDVNVMPFDSNLLDIDLSDVDYYAPESVLGLSSKRRTVTGSLSMSGDGSQSAAEVEKYASKERVEDPELMAISGTCNMEFENAKLKAELASKIALICSMSTDFDSESLDESRIERLLRNAAEKTSEALHLKDEYEKHLQSMLKAKQIQCDSYEKRIEELEQRLSDHKVVYSNEKSDENKSEVSAAGEFHMHHAGEEISSAQEGLDDNMTDSSSMLNLQLDSSMVDLNRNEGQLCDKEKKETQVSGGPPFASSNMAVSISKPEDVISSEGGVRSGLEGNVEDNVEIELQSALAEKSSQLDNADTKIKALFDEASKLGRELEINRKLLNESQMNCARLENSLHDAREEAQMHLCTADRRASQYSALRISSVKTHSLYERLQSCVSSSDVGTFAESLSTFAQSLASISSANESDDVGIAEFRECILAVADKVGLLSRQRAELLDRLSKVEAANEQLNKELDEKAEVVNTLFMKRQHEKQASKEKISYTRLEIHEITAFVLNTYGHYEAINRNSRYYYLSSESVALFTDHLPSRPSYIIGQVVHIEKQIVKPPPTSDREHVDTKLTSKQGMAPNPYGLPVGCEYFIVTVAMLPDTVVHSPSPSPPAS